MQREKGGGDGHGFGDGHGLYWSNGGATQAAAPNRVKVTRSWGERAIPIPAMYCRICTLAAVRMI